MDLATQNQILEIARSSGTPPLVLLGSPDPESAELSARTVTSGDPTFAGPLAGVPLGLPVYHILEEDIEAASDHTAYQEQIGVMKLALPAGDICATVAKIRRGG
jgi:hypothetical protein